jgi:hypothetical protein
MRTATGLTLVAIGAIFAFAIRTTPSFLDLQTTGWVIMLTGVAGMLIPRRGNARIRRRTVVRRPRGTGAAATGPRALGAGRVFRRPAGPVTPLAEPVPPAAGSPVKQTIPGTVEPAEETVEEYFQD